MIGSRLTQLLLQKGCRVSHMGRKKRAGLVPSYVWDVERGTIENGAFNGIDTVIHLAGSGVADKRWSSSRKQEILDSRIKSTALLHAHLKANPYSVRTVVGASAIGYYGFSLQNDLLSEESPPGSDFLAGVVVNWEKEVDRIETLGIRVVKVRIGIVLSEQGGALKELAWPTRWGFGASLGTGQQMTSWIHLDDLCEMFAMAVENGQMAGVYNATAPDPVTNRTLTESIARTVGRKILLPNISSTMLHILVGEMASMLLCGSNVSSRKIQESGFRFTHPELMGALKDLLN